MSRKNARNNEMLGISKETMSPKIYSIVLNLINNGREDLAPLVQKIDFLLEYASSCIKDKEYEEAEEALNKAKIRIDMIKREGQDTEYLDYLLEGISDKARH